MKEGREGRREGEGGREGGREEGRKEGRKEGGEPSDPATALRGRRGRALRAQRPSALCRSRPGSRGGGHSQARRGGPLAEGQRYLQARLSRSSCERTGAASRHRWLFVPRHLPSACLSK